MHTCQPCDGRSIKAFEGFVAAAWGGPERLTALFDTSPDYRRAFDDAVWGRYRGALDHPVLWPEGAGCRPGPAQAFRNWMRDRYQLLPALATACKSIIAFDVVDKDVALATERFACFGAYTPPRALATSFDESWRRSRARPMSMGC